jgi:hypothetical protein
MRPDGVEMVARGVIRRVDGVRTDGPIPAYCKNGLHGLKDLDAPVPAGCVLTPQGHVVEAGVGTPAARHAFTPEELDARLLAIQARVLREAPPGQLGRLLEKERRDRRDN